MNLKNKHARRTDRFLRQAFETGHQRQLIRAARIRRNLYLALFIAGIGGMFATALIGRQALSFLLAGATALSLVVMTKYETQLYFLRLIEEKNKPEPSDTPPD